MSYGEEQQKEIETIRERKITVKLSDADCDRLVKKCGEYGLTIGELIENFVGDLVDGTYSNGSDERMYAQQWFERCWFGMFPEPSLLNHLLSEGHEPQHFLDALNNIETAKRDIKQSQKDIAEPTDEWKNIYHHKYNDDFTSYKIVHAYNNVEEFIEHEKECLESYKDDLREWTEERDMMLENWDSSNVDLEEEIENVKKWVSEKDNLLKIIDNKKTDIEKKENKKVKKTPGIRVR